jgi:hypothetical protein
MAQFIQFADYTASVRADQNSAPVLADQLRNHAPRDADHDEKKALAAVVEDGHAISEVVSARERASPASVRAQWLDVQSAWGGAFDVASGKARLDAGTDVGAAAREIIDTFFSSGVPVAHHDASDTYSISRRLLGRIDDEKLAKTFELVVGAELFDMLHTKTDALGEAIGAGATRAQSVPSSTAVQERLVQFGRKVGRYCRLLAAKVDEGDPESVQRFLDAVKPIDDLRASSRAGANSSAAPTPPAPAPTNGASHPDATHA